ncbi:MAG: Ig-like domain repeat protein, partial [Actinobacteria bacterium]|nr:Ig-like domain repeat protein [Actinomycetota bacterium]
MNRKVLPVSLATVLLVGLIAGTPVGAATAAQPRPAQATAPSSTAAQQQISYIDKGRIWVSTLDGRHKRSVSGAAPTGRSWTEQAQSDDGWIIGVARKPGGFGAAAPTRLWSPDGKVKRQSTLGYDFNHPSAAVPVNLDLTPGGKVAVYTYSDLRYSYPVSTLYQGTWVVNTSNTSMTPFNINELIGSSLVGNRLIGVGAHVSAEDGNIKIQAPTTGTPFGPDFLTWFGLTGAWSLDMAANGKVLAARYRLTNEAPITLGLASTTRLGGGLTGACDMTSVGAVQSVSLSQDGKWLAWQDDRGLMAARVPAITSGTCAPVSPVLISKTGTYPSIGASRLATGAAKKSPQLRATLVAKAVRSTAHAKLKVVVKASGLSASKVTGKVTVKDGKRLVGSGKLSGGKATIKLKRITKLGSHKLVVAYAGNSKITAKTTTV